MTQIYDFQKTTDDDELGGPFPHIATEWQVCPTGTTSWIGFVIANDAETEFEFGAVQDEDFTADQLREIAEFIGQQNKLV